MTRSIGLMVSLALGLTVACASPPEPPAVQGPTPDEMIASAKALDASFLAAFNGGDVEALNALYWNSPDVVSFYPDGSAIGIDALKAANAATMEIMQGNATLELTEVHYTVIGDSVATWATWKMTMPGPDGSPMELTGRYTDLKAERDGKWVYTIEHVSVPMPPPPSM